LDEILKDGKYILKIFGGLSLSGLEKVNEKKLELLL
jgi:hypothetical protein